MKPLASSSSSGAQPAGGRKTASGSAGGYQPTDMQEQQRLPSLPPSFMGFNHSSTIDRSDDAGFNSQEHAASLQRFDDPLKLGYMLLRSELSPLSARDLDLFSEVVASPPIPSAESADKVSKAKRRKAMLNSVGEHRLKIDFVDFGVPGNEVQFLRYRRGNASVIPDGLIGTTESYGEPWRISTRHVKRETRTVVEWTICNLNTNTETIRLETEEEALPRESQARTVTNYVFKDAMNARAKELEQELDAIDDADGKAEEKRSVLKQRIKSLSPKRVLIGPLFFGLQHKSVQQRMNELLGGSWSFPFPTAAAASADTRRDFTETSRQQYQRQPMRQPSSFSQRRRGRRKKGDEVESDGDGGEEIKT